MLARRLTTILPAMSLAEALETTRIHSVAGLTGARTAMVTTPPMPGEGSLAHCHLDLGQLYHQTGRAEQARAALTTAIDLYRAMDMSFWLPQAEAALAQVEGSKGL
jgi:hypothetical protein